MPVRFNERENRNEDAIRVCISPNRKRGQILRFSYTAVPIMSIYMAGGGKGATIYKKAFILPVVGMARIGRVVPNAVEVVMAVQVP